jgi:hypothetical protein
MQSRNQRQMMVAFISMIVSSLTFLSFLPGGDHYEVYLNKKLVFTQIVSQPASIKSLALDQRNINDQVDVYYSHCGKLGTNRTIAIKDGKNVLKQWRFSDAAGKFMSLGAREILAFETKNTDRKLNLYYCSEQMPDGKLLASIVLDTDVNKAAP